MTDSDNLKRFNEGELILREGHSVPYAYLIRKGSVRVYRITNNRQILLSHLGPGQLFGEMGILTGMPASANVAAETYTEAMPISPSMFRTLLDKSSEPVRKILTSLIDRLRHTNAMIRGQDTKNIFFSICQILALMDRTQRVEMELRRVRQAPGLNYGEVSRSIRSILLISQLEIDSILQKLFNLGLINIEEITKVRYKKGGSRDISKADKYVDDRLIHFNEPETFLEKAKIVSEELLQDDNWCSAMEMEFVDIYDFAASLGTTPDIIYKKIGSEDIPPNLFFLHKSSAETWARDMGQDFFKKAKRRQLDIQDMEGVDDIIFIDDETLRQTFTHLGFHKLSILFAASGDKAKEKIIANVSRKIAGVVQEESSHLMLDEDQLSAVERELLDTIRSLKGR